MKKIIFLIQGIVLLAIGMSYGQAKITPDSTRALSAKPSPGLQWSRGMQDGKAVYYMFDPQTLKSYPMYTGQYANYIFLGKQEAAGLYQPLGNYQPLGSYAPATGSTSYLPYSGAIGSVWLGNYSLSARNLLGMGIRTNIIYFNNGYGTLTSDSSSAPNHAGNLVVKTDGIHSTSAGLSLNTRLITGNRLITWQDKDITVAGLADLAGFVPYSGATADINIGNHQMIANSYVKSGGLANQYLMADGSTTSVVPSSGNGGGGITSLTTSGSGSATLSGTVLNIPTPSVGSLGAQPIEDQRLSSTDWVRFINLNSDFGVSAGFAGGDAMSMAYSSISAYDAGHGAHRAILGLKNSGTDMYFGNYLSDAGRTMIYGSGIDFYSPRPSSSVLLGTIDSTGISAKSFKKSDGTSTQYLMADGSVSTLSLTTNPTNSQATLVNGNLNIPTPTLIGLGGQQKENQRLSTSDNVIFNSIDVKSSIGSGAGYFDSLTAGDFSTQPGGNGSGHGLIMAADGTMNNSPSWEFYRGPDGINSLSRVGYIGNSPSGLNYYADKGYGHTFNNSVTADSFVKSGGLSSQVLMADGSVKQQITLTNNGSGSATLSANNVLNIPTPTVSSLGAEPVQNGVGLVRKNGNSISFDNNTYYKQNDAAIFTSIAKQGGLSNQYLMADGSVSNGPSTFNLNLTTQGSSGAASFSNNVLNIPTPTLAALGGQPIEDQSLNTSNDVKFKTINSTGNVKIGTNVSPANLDVAGVVHSKEVLVNLTGFSDYVFDKDYKLPELTKVKSYLDKNHHLADMPSEKDVVSNGLKVGEVTNILTKKIEELTLYIIEKDNELKAQNLRIQKLEKCPRGHSKSNRKS